MLVTHTKSFKKLWRL